jgi:ABC-type polysaccharide transport system permease subunit
MALPFLLPVILFSYMPLFGWSLAFYNYKPGIPIFQNEFVGFRYFIMFLTDRVDMLRVMKNTVVFALLGYLVSPLPMLFAIMLNELRSVRYKKLVQTFTTVPNFISWVIIFSLAFMIFSTEGVLNSFLTSIGLQAVPTVLGNNDAVYWFQTAIGQWKGVGWGAIIYLAAIAGIDQELYEAAAIDGANRLKNIWHITVPLLMPTYLVLLLLSIGNFVNVGFEQFFVFNNPVVARNIEVLDLYVYRRVLMGQDYSFAIAIGIMKSVVGITLLFIGNAIAKRVRGTNLI